MYHLLGTPLPPTVHACYPGTPVHPAGAPTGTPAGWYPGGVPSLVAGFVTMEEAWNRARGSLLKTSGKPGIGSGEPPGGLLEAWNRARRASWDTSGSLESGPFCLSGKPGSGPVLPLWEAWETWNLARSDTLGSLESGLF